MTFAYPWLLALLALIPLIAWRLGKAGPLPSVTLPTIKPLAGLGRAPRRHTGRFRWPLTLIALALMIVALARPRVPRGETPDPSKGIDIMLTLDFSRSMAEEDFRMDGKRVSRRAALQKVVEEFVANRPHDRIGIVCFARSPALVSPLTLDHEWAMNSLRETDYMTGTAIGEGMAASLQFLKRHSQRSKALILVTDGHNMIGRPPLAIAPFISRGNCSAQRRGASRIESRRAHDWRSIFPGARRRISRAHLWAHRSARKESASGKTFSGVERAFSMACERGAFSGDG